MSEGERTGDSVADESRRADVKPARAHRPRIWIVFALLAVFGSAMILVLRVEALDPSSETTQRRGPRPVEIVAARSDSLAVRITGTSNLVAHKSVMVTTEIEGKISEIFIDEGERVERGDRLLALDDRALQLVVSQATIEQAQARREHTRARILRQRGIVSAEELEKLKSAKELAAQVLARAKNELKRAQVVAPFEGRIIRRHVEVGQYVRAAEPLLELIDDSVLEAELFVSERNALDLIPGRPVEVQLVAKPAVVTTGSVRSIDPVVDVETGTVRIVVEVREPSPSMRSGSFVRLSLVLRNYDDVCLVSRKAVEFQAGGGARVFVVEGGVARARAVEVGIREEEDVQILSGLEPGERVVSVGRADLVDGQAIENSAERPKGL